MVEAALSGVGLAYVWEERARPHVENGSLVECLASWSAPEDWLYLYCPTRIPVGWPARRHRGVARLKGGCAGGSDPFRPSVFFRPVFGRHPCDNSDKVSHSFLREPSRQVRELKVIIRFFWRSSI